MKSFGQNNQKQRILIVSSIDISLLRFRGRLIELLISTGYNVYLVAPSFNKEIEVKLNELGASTLTVPMSRSGLSITEDYRTYRSIKKIICEKKIDLVFPYTIKPVMYSSLAASKLNVPVIGLVNGIGYLFTGSTLRQRLLRSLVVPVYKFCIKKNQYMVFQNPDDLQLFRDKKICAETTNLKVVAGSGVDLNQFPWRPPRKAKNLRFAFIGRLLVEKGILLYLDAAKEFSGKFENVEFHVFGEPQLESANSISLSRLQEYIEENAVVYHGRVDDIAAHLNNLDVIVFPSWYREGVPRALLEGLSCGIAIITTESPGCREAVVNGLNGILISPESISELKNAIEHMVVNPDVIRRMSYESRALAEHKFDVNIVNRNLLACFDTVLSSKND